MGRPPGSPNKNKSPTRLRREARKAARIASGAKPRQKRREQFSLGLDLPIVDPADRPNRPKSARGRKSILSFDELTLQRLWSLGIVQSTLEEAAEGFNVSRETLRAFFRDNVIAAEIWEDAGLAGRSSLRSHVYGEAMSGNTPVLVLAAEHWLGMKGKPAAGEVVDESAVREAMEHIGAGIRARLGSVLDAPSCAPDAALGGQDGRNAPPKLVR